MVLRAFIVMHLINAGLRAFISVACFYRGGGVYVHHKLFSIEALGGTHEEVHWQG